MTSISQYIRQLLGSHATSPLLQRKHREFRAKKRFHHQAAFVSAPTYSADQLLKLQRSLNPIAVRRVRRLTGGNRTRHMLSHSNLR